MSGDRPENRRVDSENAQESVNYPQDIHRQDARFSGDTGSQSPENSDLSTVDDAELSTVDARQDLASNALRSARSIAAGRGGGKSARLRRRRRGSGDGGYSGARPDGRDPAPLGKILGQSIQELGWTAPLAEGRLFGQWASVVGADIAARCQPMSLVDGELKISAESTAWATQLRLMTPQLLARIGRELPAGTVAKLVITGPSAPSWKRGPWSMRGGRGVRDTYG